MVASHGTDGQPGGPGAKLREAVDHYSAAIERLQNFPEAWENRAYIVMRWGSFDHAIRGFEKAVEMAPFRFQSWQLMAQAYRAKGDAERARSCAQRAAEEQARNRRMPWVR